MHVSIIVLNNHNLSIDHNINIFVIIQHNLNTSVTRKDLCMSFFIQKYSHFMFLQWCSHCTHTLNQSSRNRDASLILMFRWIRTLQMTCLLCFSFSLLSVCWFPSSLWRWVSTVCLQCDSIRFISVNIIPKYETMLCFKFGQMFRWKPG